MYRAVGETLNIGNRAIYFLIKEHSVFFPFVFTFYQSVGSYVLYKWNIKKQYIYSLQLIFASTV